MTCSIGELFREGVILVKGYPGAGKTLLVAKTVSQYNNVAWFTFYETEDRLRKYLTSAGVRPPAHIFGIVSTSPDEAVNFIVEKVLEVKPDVVVVDGVSALTAAGERELVHAVFYHGISRDVPVVLIKEGVDVTPSEYVADVILELEHVIVPGGMSLRRLKILKTRGRAIPLVEVPFVIADEGPVVLPYTAEARQPPSEKLTTGAPEIDEALGGGVWSGSLVAVVGPHDGLASKLMVLTAAALARQGRRVLYHHHKVFPTFVKFAENLGVKLQRPNLDWYYHPVVEHKVLTWWYKSAKIVESGGYDVHFADQYEQVAAVAGVELLAEAAMVYQSLLKGKTTTVLIFNSHDTWRRVATRLGSAVDYVFLFRHGQLVAYTPDNAAPVRFKFRIDMEKKRVVYERI